MECHYIGIVSIVFHELFLSSVLGDTVWFFRLFVCFVLFLALCSRIFLEIDTRALHSVEIDTRALLSAASVLGSASKGHERAIARPEEEG